MAKRTRYDPVGAATAQFYNATGTVPTSLNLAQDTSYLFSTQPSCVLAVADLPPNCSDTDIVNLFSRYGMVTGAKMMCNGHVALVEFSEISSPTKLVHMAKINPFCVGPNRVRLEFSSETLRLDDNKSNNMQAGASVTTIPTKILHLDIAAADYPITVDVIKAICSAHGKLVRIFIGKKQVDRSMEALVEFTTVEEASAAKKQLDGADIYSGCCSLTAAFSPLPRVHVTKNDTETWDFMNEGPLLSGTPQRTLLGHAAQGTPQVQQNIQPILQQPSAVVHAAPVAYPMPPTMAPPMMPPPSQPQAGYYGAPYGAPPMYGYPQYPPMGQQMLPQGPPFRPQQPTSVPVRRPNIPAQATVLPTPPAIHQVSATGIGMGHSTSTMTPFGQPMTTDPSIFETIEGVVIMACNLPENLNCDNLFNLFCLYGNIARVKFLKTRVGCAMVQVGNAEAGDFIHRYYNGINIFDHVIQIHHSKQTELSEHENPGVLADKSPVMKNYMSDPNNRFRNAVVASKSRILDPCRTLHFFNAPLNFTPEDICRVFTEAGATAPPRVVIFSPKNNQKTSLGLIEWDKLSDSLEALLLANHRPIHLAGCSHPFHLKLAFSPKPISDDRAGVSLIRYPAPPLNAQPSDTAIKSENGNSPEKNEPLKRKALDAGLDGNGDE